MMQGSIETPEPSPLLLAFVQRQISQADHYNGHERRAGYRPLLAKSVLVYPADEHFSPTGPSRVMVIRDVSCRSMGLVHDESINWPLLLVRISLPETEALLGMVVRWRRPIGPFYLLGCVLHTNFDDI